MCLVLIDNNTKPSIAEEDIIVYKVGTSGIDYLSFNLFKEYWFKPYIHSSYKYIKHKKNPIIELIPIKDKNQYIINEGYHAYINYSIAYGVKWYGLDIAEFKIPKGSLYFRGNNHDIVANQMIYLNICPK